MSKKEKKDQPDAKPLSKHEFENIVCPSCQTARPKSQRKCSDDLCTTNL